MLRVTKQFGSSLLLILCLSINSISYAQANAQDENTSITPITHSNHQTKEQEILTNTSHLKNLLSIFNGWADPKKISPADRIKVIYGDLNTSKQLILLERSKINATYLHFDSEGKSTRELQDDVSLFFNNLPDLSKNPRPIIVHIELSGDTRIFYPDYWDIFNQFNDTLEKDNATLIISTNSSLNLASIRSGSHYSQDYPDHKTLDEITSIYQIIYPSYKERQEIISLLTQDYTYDKNASLDSLSLITHGYTFYDIYSLLTSVKKKIKNNTIDMNAIRIAQEDSKHIYQPLSSITPEKNNSSSSKKEAFEFYPAGEIDLSFTDVAGLDSAKEELNVYLHYLKQPEKFKAIGATMPKGLILYGPPGTGKTYLAKAFAGEAKLNFIYVSSSQFLQGFVGEAAKSIHAAFEYARNNKPCILFIDEIDGIAEKRSESSSSSNRETVNQLLIELDSINSAANEGLIVIAATNQLDRIDSAILRPGRFDSHIYLGIPTEQDRKTLITSLTQKYKVNDKIDLNELARTTQGWTTAKITNFFNIAAIHAVLQNKSMIDEASFAEAREKILEETRNFHEKPKDIDNKFQIILPEDVQTTFAQVGGLSEAKQELKDILYFIKNVDKLKNAGVTIPKGAILYGPPGTGKTMLARALAGEANVSFISLSATELMGQYIGHSAPMIRNLFTLARAISPAIIFIDEFDAIVQSRNSTNSNSINQEIVNQLLAELDGIKEDKNNMIFIVAATNRLDTIDPAILRPGRFDRHINVSYPDKADREDICRIFFESYAVDKSIKPIDIANMTQGWSPSQIKQLFNEAAIRTVKNNQSHITINDFATAKDRILIGSKSIVIKDKAALELTAYHEAGHALMAYLLPESNKKVEKINIMARGDTLGVTIFQPDEESFSISYKTLRAHIAVALGGRAAEEILRGPDGITSGISSDLSHASDIAFRMLTQYGYSTTNGLIAYPYRNISIGTASSEVMQEMKKILDEEYTRTLKLLTENKQKLEKIVHALLEKESLTEAEFYKLLSEQK